MDILGSDEADHADGQGADVSDDAPSFYARAPRTTAFNKLRKRLVRLTREAMDDFSMVDPRTRGRGERWLVCLSGGKDSYTLLTILMDLKWRGLLQADLLVCNLDQGQPNFPKHILPEYLETLGVEHRIEYQDTYSIVIDKVPEGRTFCSLCSRLRRGHLYRIAREEDCRAIVLGHHREDLLETFLLNLFHQGRLAAMPPKLLNDEKDVLALRPLAYCPEEDIARFSRAMAYPIIPCDLCGSQEGLQREMMKQMLDGWEKKAPGKKAVLLRAMMNVRESQLLDPKVFDFEGLEPSPSVE